MTLPSPSFKPRCWPRIPGRPSGAASGATVPVSRPAREYDLDRIARVRVVGFGKAGAAMAQATEEILGDKLDGGWVSVKYGHLAPLRKIHLHEAGHPLPDANSVRGAEAILSLLDETTADDWSSA